ncbi:Os08g0484300, partial [Oryza sativa Japonica Group]
KCATEHLSRLKIKFNYFFCFFPGFSFITSSMYNMPFPLYTSGVLLFRTAPAKWCTLFLSIPVQHIKLGLKQKTRTAGGAVNCTSWL